MTFRGIAAVAGACWLLVMPGRVFAQAGETVTGSPRESAPAARPFDPSASALVLAGPVDPALYRVGPGDRFVLQLRGAVSRSIPLEVDPEGLLLVPEVGAVRVGGQSLAQVREAVLAKVRGQFRSVSADLQLSRPRTFRVFVTGQVRTPGPRDVDATRRMSDLLGRDDFLEGASYRRILVRHSSGPAEECDLGRFLLTGQDDALPFLRDGDVVHVPNATEFAVVQGAVARPGRYELGGTDRVRTLLQMAGGPLPSALVEEILLVHFHDSARPDSIRLDLEGVYANTFNPELEDGDHLYVYFLPSYRQQHEAHVLGEVQRPGAYPIAEGHTRLSALVHSAGGFLPGADLAAVRVRRHSNLPNDKDPELERLLRLSRGEQTASEYELLRARLAGQREEYRVDWYQVLRDSSRDLLLRDGDVIQVDRLVSSIRVDGEVRRPGILNHVPGSTVDAYVQRAGGFTSRAWRGKVRVTRAVTGQTLLARNVRSLDPGDFVWVPERPDRTVWEQAGVVLTSLAQIAAIVIAIRSVR